MLNDQISEIVRIIREEQNQLKSFSQSLREALKRIHIREEGQEKPILKSIRDALDVGESPFFSEHPSFGTKGISVAAVDGGTAQVPFLSFNIFFQRSAGVLFKYKDTEIKTQRIPSELIEDAVKIRILPKESEIYNSSMKSILRLIQERKMAVKMIEKFKPDYLLVDGPLTLPQISSYKREMKDLWQRLLREQSDLWRKANEQRTQIIGVIKDSNARYYTEQFLSKMTGLAQIDLFSFMKGGKYRALLSRINDMMLGAYMLNRAEATHPRKIRNLEGENNKKIWQTLLKTAENDHPIAIHFVSSPDSLLTTHQRTCATIMSLCGKTPEFSIPLPIIEVDAMVKIREPEIEIIVDEIMSQTNVEMRLLKLKRDKLPF